MLVDNNVKDLQGLICFAKSIDPTQHLCHIAFPKLLTMLCQAQVVGSFGFSLDDAFIQTRLNPNSQSIQFSGAIPRNIQGGNNKLWIAPANSHQCNQFAGKVDFILVNVEDSGVSMAECLIQGFGLLALDGFLGLVKSDGAVSLLYQKTDTAFIEIW